MTEERRIQLVSEVDATGARAGLQEIQREAGTMAAAVARSSQQADAAAAGIGRGARTSAGNLEAAQRNLIGSIQRTTAAMEAGSRTGAAYYEILARQRGVDPAVLAPYLAQLRAVEAAQARANVQVAGATAPLRQVGVSAAQTAAALRGVPAQFTDIITSLQGGQAPLTVLFQQGGQLRDMFGSAGGAARALGGYVLGLVNPMTIAAAAAAGLAYAHHLGAEESKAYTRALILTNNAAGATADGMAEASRRIGKIAGDQGVAAAAIASLAASGKVPAENMQRFAQVTVEAQRVIGRSVEDTVADFDALGKSPLTALAQINDKYHFITAATYAQVKALVDQGRAAEAANVAQQAYADGVDRQRQKVLDSLTDWERGWIRIKKAAGGALDAVLDFGRGATNFEKISSLLKQYETAEANKASSEKLNDAAAAARFQSQMDRTKTEINTLRAKDDAAKEGAKTESESQKRNDAQKKWADDNDKYLTRAAQLERDIAKARNEGQVAFADKDPVEREKLINDRIAGIRKGYSDIFNDGVDSNIEALKRRAAVEDELTQRTIAGIAARRNIGGITEEQAINQTADAEDKAFVRRIAALEKEKALLKEKQNSRKDQAAKQGEIDVMQEQRTSAQIKREQELGALAEARIRRSIDLAGAGITAASQERAGYVESARVQREYNEEIGLTATEIFKLREQRVETLAGLKEETAAALEATKPGNDLAQIYRDQAAAMRDRSAATRDGFVKERDPWTVLTLSAKRYGEEASNVGAQVGDALTNAFRGAEDAFAQFVTTGKLSFTSFANSILADFARIAAKNALAPLFSMAANAAGSAIGGNWLGDFGPSLAGARANGGPVSSGASYLVGERGPEIFTPSSSGRIIANHQMGGAGGDVNISFSTVIGDSKSSTQSEGGTGQNSRAAIDALHASFKQWLGTETRQGGIIWNIQQGRA